MSWRRNRRRIDCLLKKNSPHEIGLNRSFSVFRNRELSKNNLRAIILGIRPIWEIKSLSFILSWSGRNVIYVDTILIYCSLIPAVILIDQLRKDYFYYFYYFHITKCSPLNIAETGSEPFTTARQGVLLSEERERKATRDSAVSRRSVRL